MKTNEGEMKLNEEDLRKFIDAEGIDAEIIRLRRRARTVEQAAGVLSTRRNRIIKPMMFIDGSGNPLLAIITGDRVVDMGKLAGVIDTNGVRMVTAWEVRLHSGYSIGEVPPIGHKTRIKTVIDDRFMRKKFVYGGGGSDTSLLKIGRGVLEDCRAQWSSQ